MRTVRTFMLASTVLAIGFQGVASAQTAPVTEDSVEGATAPDGTTQVGNEAPASAADIVVTGYRASLQSARDAKKRSDSIIDTVVAEDLGQLPDNSATEALARLPGVQVFRNRGEGQALTVRGLSQVLTTLNGQESYNGSSRRSLLNTYPAGLLRSITVYKALTPDLIEGGIGGAIDVQLRQPFDFKKGLVVAGTLRGSYDDQADKLFYNGDILLSGRWQTGIGEMGLLLNASYLRRDYFESYRENSQPITNTAATNSPAGLGPVLVPSGILVKQPYGNYRRPVFTGSFQWKPASNLRLDLRVTNINDHNTFFDNDLTTTIAATTPLSNVVLVPGTNIVKSASFNVAANSPGPRSSYNENNINTTQGEFGLQWITGRATLSTNVVYTRSTQTQEQQLFQLGFRTAQQVNAVFQSDSKYGGLAYNYTSANLSDPNSFYLRAYSDLATKAKGRGVQWRTDLDLDIGTGIFRAIKTGFRYAERSTDFTSGTRLAGLSSARALASYPGGDNLEVPPRGFRGDDVSVPDSWVQYRASLLSDTSTYNAFNKFISTLSGTGYSGTALFATERPVSDPLMAFDGIEKSYAYYAQAKYGLDLGSVTIDGVVGARLVNTALEINGTRVATQRNAAGVTTVTNTPINGRQNYVDVDPSVSAVAHFGRNVQLRAAWTKTFTRPDFSQLNPTLNLVETTAASIATAGNPDLRPIRSTNWDASLEWYFGRAGSASVAVFKRDVNGFFFRTTTPETLPNAIGAVTQVSRWQNAGDGTIKGFELSGTTFFDFAPGILHNIGAQANFTYIDTNQTLQVATATLPRLDAPITGISKTSINSALFYDDGRFRARLAYSVRSRFVLAYVVNANGQSISNTNNLNWYPISRLDASTSYRVTNNITVTIDGQNLLGKPQRAFWGNAQLDDSNFDDRVYFEGRVFSAAVRFKF